MIVGAAARYLHWRLASQDEFLQTLLTRVKMVFTTGLGPHVSTDRMSISLIGRLPAGPLDLIGDVHGEMQALADLLAVLGYDAQGHHPRGRTLVFVGDLCDRGPDSPAVVDWVRRACQAGTAVAVMGNHELNLLRGQRKDGNDWLHGNLSTDGQRYLPMRMLAEGKAAEVLAFFDTLPIALERPDLRVVHAAWHTPSIARLRGLHGVPSAEFRRLEVAFRSDPDNQRLALAAGEERGPWRAQLLDARASLPNLPQVARWDALRQMGNPIRVLTSGVEHPQGDPFFAGGQWRFVQRASWWDSYLDPVPVVVGHYWRRFVPPGAPAVQRQGHDMFADVPSRRWHGACGQVFCVDFSVGGRFLERQHGRDRQFDGRLAALRWPERSLFFDDGSSCPTEAYGGMRL